MPTSNIQINTCQISASANTYYGSFATMTTTLMPPPMTSINVPRPFAELTAPTDKTKNYSSNVTVAFTHNMSWSLAFQVVRAS